MPRILALDLSRTIGWATAEPGGPLDFGHQRLGGKNALPGRVGVEQGLFVTALIDTVKPSLLVYEQPFLSQNFNTTFMLLGLAFSIDMIAIKSGIEFASVLSLEAVKALTGRGRFAGKDYTERRKAKKLATMEACWARGWRCTEDEADAIAVLLLAEQKRYPVEALSRARVLKQPTGPLFARGVA